MISALLDWFEEHKVGIIGTLTLHSVILFALTFAQLRSTPTEDEISEMRIDVMNVEEADAMVERIINKETGVPEKVTNLSSNITAEIKPQFSQARLSEKVETELREMERAEFERLEQERKERGEEITIPELDPSKWNKEQYMDKAVAPARVEGATTVWYDLKDRVRGNGIPGYLCKDRGRVAIRVQVDRSGQVRKAELDAAQSFNVDDCMLEQAIRSAKSTPFNARSSAPDPQTGTVYFLFLPQ
ncbi:MAG: hypothetical protein IPP83_02600 [Flavobacteriales bacterium]|nr:hypothetical protein [Flavobacteriales bacterium]